jgi:hypothetical protein
MIIIFNILFSIAYYGFSISFPVVLQPAFMQVVNSGFFFSVFILRALSLNFLCIYLFFIPVFNSS